MAQETSACEWLPLKNEPGLVSIVIPTFNREGMLAETLESVFRQDYRPIEIIVADDGSTDGTAAMLESLAPPAGVTLKVSKGGHEGAAAARNRGAAISRGEFIMFLDSDDVLHEGSLTALVGAMGAGDLTFGQWRDWYSDETPPRFGETCRRAPADDLLVSLLRNEWLLPSAVLHRRASLLRAGPWDDSFGVQDDHEFMCRLALAECKASGVDHLVADYRRHNRGQLSLADAAEVSLANERILRSVERALEARGWTDERRRALAWRWFWEARKAWVHGLRRERFAALVREVHRVQPGFRAPKWWYRVIAAVAGYANAERVAAVGRRLLRRG
jgi:glycosyltransferase involved in cell wall biosynthesis